MLYRKTPNAQMQFIGGFLDISNVSDKKATAQMNSKFFVYPIHTVLHNMRLGER